MPTTHTTAAHDFLDDALPDPNDVGEAVYRAIYDLLSDVADNGGTLSALARELEEAEAIVRDLQARLAQWTEQPDLDAPHLLPEDFAV